MKTKLIAIVFLAATAAFAQPRFGVRVGVGFGYAPAPVAMYAAPPAPLYAAVPVRPGPAYGYVNGYWYPAGARYALRAGYWAPRPFANAYWVRPHYAGGRYFGGYWRR
jgi:hypothetical protein